MGAIVRFILWWFGAAYGAVKGRINYEELVRVVITTLTAGGGVAAVLAGIQGSLGTIWTDKASYAAVAMVVTFLMGLAHRLSHGFDPRAMTTTQVIQAAQAKGLNTTDARAYPPEA